MRRFFVPPELSRDDVFELPEREARHAAQVLRLGPGDELTVLDGAGCVMRCVVESASKRSVRGKVFERQHRAPLPCAITLIQAVPKGPAFETIVQKATELGVACIVPLLSERVVAHISEKDSAAKVEKWRQIAIESIKQCGSPWLPVIECPIGFDRLVAQLRSDQPTPNSSEEGSHTASAARTDVPLPGGVRGGSTEFSIVCSLEEHTRTMREAVSEFRAKEQHPPTYATIWIGPEGDFTPAEYAAIAELGATSITLGPLVLRADTAAVACLAVANQEL